MHQRRALVNPGEFCGHKMIRDLFIRCKSYTDLAGKFTTRSISIQRFDGDATYAERKNKIRMLDASDVHRIACECGWDDY